METVAATRTGAGQTRLLVVAPMIAPSSPRPLTVEAHPAAVIRLHCPPSSRKGRRFCRCSLPPPRAECTGSGASLADPPPPPETHVQAAGDGTRLVVSRLVRWHP
eukprot:scaffold2352_cov103-Isochrysis_galbana.AAC.4